MVSIFSLFLRLFTRLPFKVKQWNKICFLNCWCWCYVEQIAISYIYIDFDCSVEGRMYWNVFRFIYNFWIVSTYLVYGQVLELISGYEKWNCLASSHQIQKKTQFNVLMMHMGKKVLGGLINLTCQQTHQRHAIRYNGIEEGYSWIVPQQSRTGSIEVMAWKTRINLRSSYFVNWIRVCRNEGTQYFLGDSMDSFWTISLTIKCSISVFSLLFVGSLVLVSFLSQVYELE